MESTQRSGDNLGASHASRLPALVTLMTCLAMLAFAANSLLTRTAFQTTTIDPASFTAIRLISGALMLVVILRLQGAKAAQARAGWGSAVLLFIYAVAFSFAYRDLSTGAGALVLFASAQLLMAAYGWYQGERTSLFGLFVALGGITAFLAPSASAPPLSAAALMAVAGVAWGGFSLLGRASDSPVANTAGSFVWALPLVVVLMLVQYQHLNVDGPGALYALLSGSLTSAIGYVVWYWVRLRMTAISAGAVQLSVPVLSAQLGIVLLSESLTWGSAVAALVTLGGVAWATLTASVSKQQHR